MRLCTSGGDYAAWRGNSGLAALLGEIALMQAAFLGVRVVGVVLLVGTVYCAVKKLLGEGAHGSLAALLGDRLKIVLLSRAGHCCRVGKTRLVCAACKDAATAGRKWLRAFFGE